MTPEQIKAFNGLLDALDKVPEERRIFMCSAALDMLQRMRPRLAALTEWTEDAVRECLVGAAEEFGCKDKDIVSVKIDSNGRSLTFGDVVVRVSPSYALAMHIDTDESNAGCVAPGTYGEVIK